MADSCVHSKTLTRGVSSTHIPLPWRSLLDRYERGHSRGLRVDVVRADRDRLEEPRCAEALLALLDRAAAEQIARRVRQPPPYDAIVHAPVSRDVDSAEYSERAWLSANDDARPGLIDRFTHDADLRIWTTVVL